MVSIQHLSAYANDPQRAAEDLAALTGGSAAPFHPLPGAWVCLFDRSWSGPLLELYPRTAALARGDDGAPVFSTLSAPATGAGTHVNLEVGRSRAEVERLCAERGLPCAWRGYGGFLDVWLDDGLLVECVCAK